MERLEAIGVPVVVANIPDVTVIPYLTSAEKLAALIGAPLSLIGPALGVAAGDYVTPGAFALAAQILTGGAPGPLPDDVVLTAAEVASIRASIAAFNDIITAQAQRHGAALVDTHALLNGLQDHGFVAGGQRLT